MVVRDGSFPHPVLGHADDVASVFDVVNIAVTPLVDDVEVRFRLRSDDPDLGSMLSAGDAQLVVRWSCAATLASGDLAVDVIADHVDGKTYAGWIDQRMVRDRVRVDVAVVAARALSDLRWTRQHTDYGTQSFAVAVGDYLADGYGFEFFADKLFDPMQPPLGSCFRLVPDPLCPRDLRLRFDDDEQVVIVMSVQMAEGLKALGHRPDLQISLVVLPALMETLSFMERNSADASSEDLSGKAWYSTIQDLADRFAARATSPLVAAQLILDHAITSTLVNPLFTEDED